MSDTFTNLGQQALAFAKKYVALVEALVSQGVPENVARDEARATALFLLFQESQENDFVGGVCPVTGTTCPVRE